MAKKKQTKARLYWIVEREAIGVWVVRPEGRTRKRLNEIQNPTMNWRDGETDPRKRTVKLAMEVARWLAEFYMKAINCPSEIKIRRVKDGQFRDPITIPRSSDPRKTKG